MTSRLISATNRQLVRPDPKWIPDNLHYEVLMGSQAYGTSQDSSDMDIYGWCMPPKSIVLPHIAGYINGFGPKPPQFSVWQQHHVQDQDHRTEYDFAIYSVVQYLNLVAENNPNMIDSLFVPAHCILHITPAAQLIRDARHRILHKGAFIKFKGYAFGQISKVRTKQIHPDMSSKRRADIEKHGFDTKFASHCVRLMDECEQILTTGDLDLQRNREQVKSIRRGEWSLESIIDWFDQKEKQLELLHANSKLPEGPDWPALTNLLLAVLETHYGTISDVPKYNDSTAILLELERLVAKYR